MNASNHTVNRDNISIQEEEKISVLLPADIQASYIKKKSSRILPNSDYKYENQSSSRKKPQIPLTSSVLVDQYKDKGAQAKYTSDVLIIGTSGAGKSLLLRRFKSIEGEIEAGTLPTMGTDLDSITINKKDVLFREVGFKLVQSWLKFSRETKVILFLVDISNYSTIAASVAEFYNLLLAIEDLEIPVILVLNKIDRHDHLSIDLVLQAFEFYELMEVRENLYLFVISAATGVNVKALGDLLDSFIQPDEKNSAKKKKKIWCC